MRVRWLRMALRNLDDEATYIALDNAAAARLVVQRALHAVAQVDKVFRLERVLGRADNVLQHLNAYALLASLYAAVEDVWLAGAPVLCLAVAAGHGALASRFWQPDRRAALHGFAKVALDTLARLIVRRTEPHVKLH